MSDVYLPYTYIIGWKKERKFYYGVRWANTGLQRTPEDDLWIHYFTSSDIVKDEYIPQYGKPDLIKIHRKFETKQEAILFEEQMLRRLIDMNKDLWLNQTANKAIPMTPKICKKVSQAKIGTKLTKNHKNNISKSLKEKYSKEPHHMLGKKLNQNTKNKMSESQKGKTKSKEVRQKISDSRKGKYTGEKASMYGKSPTNCQKVMIDKNLYNSITEAAKILNKNRTTIQKWIKNRKAIKVK